MRHAALDVIHSEHQALSAMLASLGLLVDKAHREGRLPDFEVLRAMLFYIDEFPERQHHPKESELLFPAVLKHHPELAPVVAKLEEEHHAGERNILALQHRLLAFEMLGEPRREAFLQALHQYVGFYRAHMAVEEQQILPAALKSLSDTDWAALNAAFASNRDPLTGHAPAADYRGLFQRIVGLAEAPVGLGGRGR